MGEDEVVQIINDVIKAEYEKNNNYLEYDRFYEALNSLLIFNRVYKDKLKLLQEDYNRIKEENRNFKNLITIEEKLNDIYKKLDYIEYKIS